MQHAMLRDPPYSNALSRFGPLLKRHTCLAWHIYAVLPHLRHHPGMGAVAPPDPERSVSMQRPTDPTMGSILHVCCILTTKLDIDINLVYLFWREMGRESEEETCLSMHDSRRRLGRRQSGHPVSNCSSGQYLINSAHADSRIAVTHINQGTKGGEYDP
jgi:hypothetical protein